jgi:hypothetical protein
VLWLWHRLPPCAEPTCYRNPVAKTV